ncbi:type I-E CRISPR-associated protein Cas6/Cse3/CasE [Nocardiopsis rhodophaea]|uniref:Type I-E CRISPR-associated protein Cas6/Cse3/CasE n=1 Tax=Nocardiopsis rhodophaea TaxID=280238 RepID=A0ABN2TBQ3_9ACTN
MFLSKIPLNVMSRTVRRDHADVHEMHRTLMSAFDEVDGEGAPRRHNGLLWRLEGDGRSRALLVQSCERPDWTRLPAGYAAGRVQVKCLQPALAAIHAGRRLAFRLVANPTRSTPPPGDETGKRGRGKRKPIHDPEQQVNWLIRQGERHGFAIPAATDGGPDVMASPMPPYIGRKSDHRPTARPDARLKITVLPVSYDGRLIVTDPEAFTAAFKDGIGRAKAYGCGLLSLAPDRRSPAGD